MSAAGVPQDLLVVAMGKGGGGELNVSSDLDLIYVYDDGGETAPRGAFGGTRTLSNHEFFERLGRKLAAALSDVTADGFVFRIDLRLRPNGDAGPLAVSSAMLEEYLVRQGREWERFAWLKGRVISAPVFADEAAFAAQVKALESTVRPFVFRKYLDFNAVAALRGLHQMIRDAEEERARHRRASRPRRQRQARPRRHPRDRVHRPDLPDHARRPRGAAARPAYGRHARGDVAAQHRRARHLRAAG
jgi:glutamate-ammonia-ligase adenylyltransferase